MRVKIALWGISLLWLWLCISVANEPRASGATYALMGIAPIAALIGWEWLRIKRQDGAKAELLRLLSLPDGQGYVHAKAGSGIAVDPKGKRVALIQGGVGKAYAYADVREWQWVQETAAEIRHSSVSMQLAATGQNIKAAIDASRATGFFVTVRDIDHPVWRVEMTAKADQARWMEIMRQEINESAGAAA